MGMMQETARWIPMLKSFNLRLQMYADPSNDAEKKTFK